MRTTVLIIFNEVNSESSTESRDIDADLSKAKTTFLIPLLNVSEFRYVDAVRTTVRNHDPIR